MDSGQVKTAAYLCISREGLDILVACVNGVLECGKRKHYMKE
jgi:hypothetical protein